MSPIAKLFTVVNVILAGLFLGWAWSLVNQQTATLADLNKAKAEAKVAQDALSSDMKKLLAEKLEIEKARATLQKEKDDALAEVDRTKEQLAGEDRKNTELRTDVKTIAASIDNLTAQNKQLQADKSKAETAQNEAEKNRNAAIAAQTEAEKAKGELDTQLTAANNRIADLEKSEKSLIEKSKSLDTQLTSLADHTGAKLSDFTPMPLIEGSVLAVASNVEPGLVTINRGSDQGVKRGYTFAIYDGTTYKGEVRVEYVHSNMCSALVISSAPGSPKIRQGDSAATRI